ncbi:MAG: hypothetical protein RR802_06060 [Erysipelotrichaceae bacterium]
MSNNPVKAVEPNSVNECIGCDFRVPEVASTGIDENGNEIKVFDDKTEVTYLENEEMIIKDYGHIYDDSFSLSTKQRSMWTLLAKVILSAVNGCSAVYYVTGVDACRIVLSYLGTNKKNNVRYELTGRYIPGKIPGCEPSHSLPCNSGYWEYRVVRA